tara:strand:+ start:373 stop:558 length:186 start_codon:yes stop_codon:yes gene_type:complete
MDKRKNSKRKLALLRQNLERRERKLKEHRELQERIRKTKKIIFCVGGLGLVAVAIAGLLYL